MISLVVMFGLAAIMFSIFWIWALVDCLLRPEESYEKMFGTISPKLVWALIIFFGHLLGAIIYLFVAGTRKNPRQTVVAADSAGTDEGERILQMVAGGKISSEEGQRLLMALGKKETEIAKSRAAAAPKALKVGCLIIVLFLILAFLMFFSMMFFSLTAAHKKAVLINNFEQQQKVTETERGNK